MATTTGASGFGATLVGGTTTPANIRTITIGGVTRNMLDTSVHGTTNGWMTFVVSGLQDPGEITVECVYEEATFTKWMAATVGAVEVWTITFIGGATWVASGAVTSVSMNTPYDDIMTCDVTIKLTGAPVYTADPA